MIRLLLALVSFTLVGCAVIQKMDVPYNQDTKWGYRAEAMSTDEMYYGRLCLSRVKILSGEMKQEGVEHDLVYGTYNDVDHVWIERKGEIIDPSIHWSDEDLYKELYRVHITGGNK